MPVNAGRPPHPPAAGGGDGTQDGNSKSAGNMNIYLIYIVYF